MQSLSCNQEYANGWRIFCDGGYLEDCATEGARDGFCAAWRQAESGEAVNWNSGPQMNGVHCPVCGADCFNTWGLIEHMKTHLKKNELTQRMEVVADIQLSDWICSQCGADCGSRIGLIMHMVGCKGNKATDLVWVSVNGFDLALFPWEDAAAAVAEAEAILSEKDSKPGLGIDDFDELEFMSSTLDELRTGSICPMQRLTAAQMSEIENERPGAEICEMPWAW